MLLPSATYRLQLNSSFTFDQLKNIIPYLHQLGISTIYASPVTQAVKGSVHGYDVTNPLQLNREIGTENELENIAGMLRQNNMSWLQDIVPNHTAFDVHNLWLQDVLERGAYSDYYTHFDIDWNYADPLLNKKLMTPFLGNNLKECIEKKEIKLVFDENGFAINYYSNRYPVAIAAYEWLLSLLTSLPENIAEELKELMQQLPAKEWQEHKKIWVKEILEDKKISAYLQHNIINFNEETELLEELLQRQHFALTHWKLSEKEINYRRFFTVNSLICLSMEEEKVFNDYHHWLYKLYQKKWIQGLRIDHIDGLYNPREYINRVKNLFGKDCYLVAEKIVAYNETIPEDWDLQGTTGYDFLGFANQLLTDEEGGNQLVTYYQKLTGEKREYEKIVFDNKINFLKDQMGGELDNLYRQLQTENLLEAYNPEKLKDALAVLLAAFPVYRLYPEKFPLDEKSRQVIEKTFDNARKNSSSLIPEIALLQTLFDDDFNSQKNEQRLLFIKRLMQFTSPLAAKGVEDTTFYMYNPLLSHNEVGDSPVRIGITPDEFHQKMIWRQHHFPLSFNATATHDTKRGEDGRIRLNILSALPDEWCNAVNKWREMNALFIQQLKDKKAPSVNDEYFIYQSLVSGFPENLKITEEYIDRLKQFMVKALREAKVFTNWPEPDEAYEKACLNFIEKIINIDHPFLEDFIPLMKKIMERAHVFSLSQTLIKLTSSGIPDIYQGSELWDLSYVDPDNRRPVDYSFRQQLLQNIMEKENQHMEEALSYIEHHKMEGAQKLFLIKQALNFRKKFPELFIKGEYIPLSFPGEDGLAYARKLENKVVVIIVPLIRKKEDQSFYNRAKEAAIQLPGDWPVNWKNEFTGEIYVADGKILLTSVFKKFPVALLFGQKD